MLKAYLSKISYIVLFWGNIYLHIQEIKEKSTHVVYYPIFRVILSLDDILCIALSILCQHLEKLMNVCTEICFMILWS